ncbi:unnamed protein product [Parajaminaea phylloscopi]
MSGPATHSYRALRSQFGLARRSIPRHLASPRSASHRAASTSSPSSILDTDDADGVGSKRTNPAPGPPKPNSPFTIFDRDAKLKQKSRAALRRSHEGPGEGRGEPGSASRTTDYVRMAAAQSLAERVLDITRQFETIVELGSGPGYLRHHLQKDGSGVKKIIMCDTSRELLYRDEHLDKDFPFEFERHVIDEEDLPFESDTVDCIVANTSLHWTNDLPGALVQIQRALRPDGVFVGSLFGGDTLFELRTSIQLAEQEREGGISPRVSPMTDTRDCASLLSRAGFSIPTVDIDEVAVSYPSIYELIHDLRDMGESNAVINRRHTLQRDTLLSAGAIYQALHGDEEMNTIPATFGIIYLIGWKPDPSQRKPLERGSASHSMKDVLGDGSGGIALSGVSSSNGAGGNRSFSTSARSRQEASAGPAQKACPACGTKLSIERATCSMRDCDRLQAIPSDVDYYSLMGLGSISQPTAPDGGWSIHMGQLKGKWREMQGLSHPDRMGGKGEEEQAIAADQSALINRAYEVLRNPILRAHYLLEQKGGSEAAPGEADSLEDPALLMQVMELREALEEAQSEADLVPIKETSAQLYDEAVERLRLCFGAPEGPQLEEAKKAATELRYWNNIQEACREWSPK